MDVETEAAPEPMQGAGLQHLISAIRTNDMVAAKANWDSVVVLDEDQLAAAGSDGLSALGLACQLGNVDMVSMLLQHPLVDPNKAKRTTTNLMIAAGRGYAGIVRVLLAHPRSDVNLKRRDAVTALLLSVQEGHREVTRALLQHPRTQPSVKALLPERLTPLVLAVRQQNPQQVALLLQSDRLLMSENVWMRETPLDFARSILNRDQSQDQANAEPCLPSLGKQQQSPIQLIVGMLEAFDASGYQGVAQMVEPCDRLFGHNIHETVGKDPAGFAHELALCNELLQCQLSPQARGKVEELQRSLLGRQSSVAERLS